MTHVHMRQGPNGLQIDDQTAAGIEQWCQHFDSVTFYGILLEASAGPSSTAWVDTHEGPIGEKAKLVALPYAYGLSKMARAFRKVRAELRGAIPRHRHLCFTLGNAIGDWPAVAAFEAIRQKRRYAAWIDRVESSIVRNKFAGSPVKRLAAEMVLPLTEGCTRYLVSKSAVALLQGGDSYEHYARSASDPHCTYDTHTHACEAIATGELVRKQARALAGEPLNIVYVGRATAMKGPFDWLDTLHRLACAQIPFTATWIGDGPDLPAIKTHAAGLGLADVVQFPGFEANRDGLLRRLKDSDLLLFCHKTPESARCLIEALVCGCPIVGYASAYPRGLVQEHGGGALAPQNDVAALAERIVRLNEDRGALAGLIGQAAASGALYNEDAVYAHRAELMRRA
ncbi:glycosyltransferase [Novosphingobium sp. Rr 2-17]|uniref:glycosyltransferase n=1 Tax=Novosphingobium sp. Rr 2-17 TaxID=555793 RepID=UPI0012F6C079|nr:glycosyltransferase [Novosphingobium sp. Rr 2-17]